jgi:signal peptide peptidase SppA
MKFPRIVQAVYWQPWLITPQMHASIRKLVESKLAGIEMPWDVQEQEQEPYTVEGGVAVIPVEGVILRKASALERMCGACGVEQVESALMAAAGDSAVRGVFLDVDSPGGTVGGVPELGELVASIGKPVMAYTGGQMCSAAYWLAAGAGEIVASQSAEVGSIGVYLPWEDWSRYYENAGVKVEVIRNDGADLKGMGYPGTALTESQRAELQKGVDQIADMFHAHVTSHRGAVNPDTMRGQAFLATEAVTRNLVDSVMGRGEALASFSRRLTQRS